MADFALARIGVSTVINKDATLADAARAAGDFDNDTDKANFGDAILTLQYDTGPPAANVAVASLYVLYGDGEAGEVFPEGGDGTVGTNVTPQAALLVGVFRSRSPSLTVDERLEIPSVPLRVGGTNRFVVLNTSGQTFDATWQLDLVKYKWTST